MALIRSLKQLQLQVEARHTEVEATYSIVKDRDGNRYLQIDTYGSPDRQIPNKKSQSVRFSPEALRDLRQILDKHFTAASPPFAVPEDR